MTRILFVGASVDGVAHMPFDYKIKFNHTGQNTGNMLIGHALKRQLVFTSYAYGSGQNMETINEDFDLIAIPAANFIFNGFDFGWLADFLEKTTMPILTVGLGAQIPSITSTDIDIPEGSKRFLKIISERGHTIGVRGEFTADALKKLGVDNIKVTGCPSLYWSLKPEISINRKQFDKNMAYAVNGSRNVVGHSFDPIEARRCECELYKFAYDTGSDYVLQNEFPEFDIAFSEVEEPSNDDLAQLVEVASQLEWQIDPVDLAKYVKKHAKAFFSVEDWANYIKTKDFSFGSRFHGNMIALINGMPAVIVCHDSRTTEMARFMKISHRLVADFSIGNIRAIYEDADFGLFESNYKKVYKDYKSFLDENKVAHNLI